VPDARAASAARRGRVLRGRRCLFVAFTLSGLQIPAAILELTGVLPVDVPGWYIVVRALVAAVQVAIAVAMARLYRDCGVWGLGRRYSAPYASRG
jgi:hypothetical protein